jgi:3-oxoacyl-[acyl-carrier-protein] synthase-3
MYRSKVIGCGSYLPPVCVTNYDLEKKVDTSHDWIVERTGIHQRYIADQGMKTSDLAYQAGLKALENAQISADEVDLVILATSTPDHHFPAAAVKVQSLLGMKRGAAFDIQAVCSGFIYALSVADNFIKTAQARTVLVLGAEIFSHLLDWNDRSTCVLFGDGAGALLLQAAPPQEEVGILSTKIYSDGNYYQDLYAENFVQMNGREVYRHAVQNMSLAAEHILKDHNLTVLDLRWFIPHQANQRIIEAVARKLSMDLDRVVVTVDQHANTSAASIPLAFSKAKEDGRLQSGDLVLMASMGAGFTWGSCLLRL